MPLRPSIADDDKPSSERRPASQLTRDINLAQLRLRSCCCSAARFVRSSSTHVPPLSNCAALHEVTVHGQLDLKLVVASSLQSSARCAVASTRRQTYPHFPRSAQEQPPRTTSSTITARILPSATNQPASRHGQDTAQLRGVRGRHPQAADERAARGRGPVPRECPIRASSKPPAPTRCRGHPEA